MRKRFRPLLALLAAEFGIDPTDTVVEASVSVELIHLGSLTTTTSSTRPTSAAPSPQCQLDQHRAILAGDFLMARASEVAATHLSQESVRLLAATYAELVEGQTRELQLQNDLTHSIDDYLQVIAGKTASLIRTSARLGAMAADATPDVVENLSEWAWEVGMVFQIADDALDLVADEATIGKPAGSDIREGTYTGPVLMAARGPEGDRVRQLLVDGEAPGEEAVAEVIRIVRDGGYVDESLRAARARLDRASDALGRLPEGEARRVLETLGAYLLERVEAVKA